MAGKKRSIGTISRKPNGRYYASISVRQPGAPVAFTTAYGFWESSTAEGLGETYRQLRRCATGRFWRDINPSSYQQRVLIDGVELTKTGVGSS